MPNRFLIIFNNIQHVIFIKSQFLSTKYPAIYQSLPVILQILTVNRKCLPVNL